MTPATLGTQLRRLIDILDKAVEASYVNAGLEYRPRFTPIVRALMLRHAMSIRALAQETGLTHSAIGQTVAQMGKTGWVRVGTGADGRERIVALSLFAKRKLPALRTHWEITNAAARSLDEQLSAPLSVLLEEAYQALLAEPFEERLKRAERNLRRGENKQ